MDLRTLRATTNSIETGAKFVENAVQTKYSVVSFVIHVGTRSPRRRPKQEPMATRVDQPEMSHLQRVKARL